MDPKTKRNWSYWLRDQKIFERRTLFWDNYINVTPLCLLMASQRVVALENGLINLLLYTNTDAIDDIGSSGLSSKEWHTNSSRTTMLRKKRKCGCEDFTTPINVTYCKYYCLIAVSSAVLFGILDLLIWFHMTCFGQLSP